MDSTGDFASVRAVLVVLGLHAFFTLLTGIFASLTGAPFVIWFRDTPIVLAALLALLLIMGILWDGTLVLVGLIAEGGERLTGRSSTTAISVASVRCWRFYTCGPMPIVLLLITTASIVGTSNLTLLNLELLARGNDFRDAWFWALERPLLERIAGSNIDVDAWDRLYHSAWLIEAVAAFVLVVIGRGTKIVLHYCVTMIALFYVGRLFGIVSPVMGPAFYRPELFTHLDGSVTAEAMRRVAEVMSLPPVEALHAGGVLLGGVSAMPSLHVAMVCATAYWLSKAARKTLVVSVPWVLLVWSSTVVLGWHYVSDGLGGIALAMGACWATTALLRALHTHGLADGQRPLRGARPASDAENITPVSPHCNGEPSCASIMAHDIYPGRTGDI